MAKFVAITHRSSITVSSETNSIPSSIHNYIILNTSSVGTMKYTFAALAVSLLFIHLHRAVSEDAKVRIFNQWPQGFYGRISVALEDEVEDGWQVTVTFSKPVAKVVVWNAVIESVSDDKKVYLIKNKFWNAQLPAGRRLKFRFLGVKARFGENRPKMSAQFTRIGEESGSGL